VPFTNGSNPNLQPETSKSKTLGVVWSPQFIQNFNVSLDWWKIRIDNTIIADSPNQILIDCYEQGIDARCLQFTRDPALGIVNKLTYGNRNAGFLETEGYDMDLTHRLATDSMGTFSTNWSTTYVSSNVFRSTNDGKVVPTPINGIATNSVSGFRVRSNLTLGWDLGDFGISWTARYYSGVKEQCLDAVKHADECSDPGVRAPWYPGSQLQPPRLDHLPRCAGALQPAVGCHGIAGCEQRVREVRPEHVQQAELGVLLLRWL